MKADIAIFPGLSQYSIEQLHRYYLLTYEAYRAEPELWTMQHCNRILTTLIGGMPFSWKVIGITRDALSLFKASNFKRKSGSGITRAHVTPRADTVGKLILASAPLSPVALVRTWIENDKTVLCARNQNRPKLPPFIEFPESNQPLFRNGHVSWKHGRSEMEFLKQLADQFNVT